MLDAADLPDDIAALKAMLIAAQAREAGKDAQIVRKDERIERLEKLRPWVIQRKVTNGYRAMWAAQAEANIRTTVDTARLKGANPFQVIASVLA